MIELYITRHGETLENASQILQGHLPGHLSELGLQQARELRDRLAHMPFDHIVVSDLQRALDTAHIVNADRQLPITVTPLLRERDWGEYTGVHIRDVQSRRVSDFPPSVENAEQLNHFDGQTVLAIGHGYFDRCIVAEIEGKIPHDVPRWDNAEVRHIRLDRHAKALKPCEGNEVSAD